MRLEGSAKFGVWFFLGRIIRVKKGCFLISFFWWRPFPYNYFNFHLSKENTGFSFKLLELLWKKFRDGRVLKISENQAVSHVYIINFFFDLVYLKTKLWVSLNYYNFRICRFYHLIFQAFPVGFPEWIV